MAAWESLQVCTLEAPPASTEWTLPSDLLLEIAARSDISTVVAFTLACKLLRRDMLTASFIRQLTQRGGIVPPCIIANLHTHNGMDDPSAPLSLVHPVTPPVSYFLSNHMSPLVSRFADDLLAEHDPLTSRGGLVLFRRRHLSDKLANLCVYDIFSGHRTFFSDPLGVGPNHSIWPPRYVLLTAEDGIDSSFLLFVLHHVMVPDERYRGTIKIHTTTPTSSTWALDIMSHSDHELFPRDWPAMHEKFTILHGGVIHWVAHKPDEIVSYNVCTMEKGTIKLPGPVINFIGELHLGSYYSRDGKKLLRLFTYHRFEISVWHQLPNRDWASEAVRINIKEKLHSVDPYGQPYWDMIVGFECSSEKNNIVLLRIYNNYYSNSRSRTLLIILDLETKVVREEQHCPTSSSMLMEIDLSSRLRAMKVYHP